MISLDLINQVLGQPAHIGVLLESFSQFSMDTRTLQPDELFFAIKTDLRDGHDFLAEVEKKASAAVVSQVNRSLRVTQWQVNDVTKAMGDMARALRLQHITIPLVGITGSCGKTSSTQLLAHICNQVGPTLASQQSFNNHWGVPITLSRLESHYCVALSEMGTSSPKEIDYLSCIAKPDIAMITIIAPVHLEGLGSLDGIAQEKSDLYVGLKPDGIVILNLDDEYKDFLKSKILPTQKIVSFSLKDPSADVSMQGAPEFSKTHSLFTLKIHERAYLVRLPLLGIHNVANALGAAACASALGIDAPIIVNALQTAEPAKQRLVRIETKKKYVVLDDSYNANPLAMKMAFQTLSREEGRRVAVLGDMAECADQSIVLHQQLAHNLKDLGIDRVYSTGHWMHAMHTQAQSLGLESYHYDQKSDLIEALNLALEPGDCVLVKGSFSSGMKMVVDAIK
jgi:UDP-N-acetylmuramoyl-tripeptide--D-alanyl-D-alanine ligase